MLTLVKICACSAAAVALSSPTSIEAPTPLTSEVADMPLSAVLDSSPPLQVATQPTCRECSFWAALSAAR
jgi:hypothetical protein